jgi:glycerol-3-phosphate O-acyltransferase
MLSSFLEAYGIVADVLRDLPVGPVEEKALAKRCLGVGRQYLLQERVHSSESVSSLLFRTGVKLAASRGLLRGGRDVAAQRVVFAKEMRELVSRGEQINRLNNERLAALISGSRRR